jgi:hypothetical protein
LFLSLLSVQFKEHLHVPVKSFSLSQPQCTHMGMELTGRSLNDWPPRLWVIMLTYADVC